jgi:Bystin
VFCQRFVALVYRSLINRVLISAVSGRYASDLAPDQKDALLDVVRAHPHPQIGQEVRRELVNAVSRGDPLKNDVEMVPV